MTSLDKYLRECESSAERLNDIADEYLYLNAPLKELKSKLLRGHAEATVNIIAMLTEAKAALEKIQKELNYKHFDDSSMTEDSCKDIVDSVLTRLNQMAEGEK